MIIFYLFIEFKIIAVVYKVQVPELTFLYTAYNNVLSFNLCDLLSATNKYPLKIKKAAL